MNFKYEMMRAELLKKTNPEKSHYWTGYMRGLRRAYYGDNFGTEEEHEKYLSLIDSDDEGYRREIGIGYRDGLAVGGMKLNPDDHYRKAGSSRSEKKVTASRTNGKSGGKPRAKFDESDLDTWFSDYTMTDKKASFSKFVENKIMEKYGYCQQTAKKLMKDAAQKDEYNKYF